MITGKINSMKILHFKLILIVFLIFQSCGMHNSKKEQINKEEQLDETLIQEYGADEYGMKQYVMALLKSGPNRSNDPQVRDSLQRAHMDNIGRLANEGKLIVAGPFLDNTPLRGIYIFDVKTIEEAEALTKTDPAIQYGSLVMELHPWYGPAGFMGLGKIQKKITRKEI